MLWPSLLVINCSLLSYWILIWLIYKLTNFDVWCLFSLFISFKRSGNRQTDWRTDICLSWAASAAENNIQPNSKTSKLSTCVNNNGMGTFMDTLKLFYFIFNFFVCILSVYLLLSLLYYINGEFNNLVIYLFYFWRAAVWRLIKTNKQDFQIIRPRFLSKFLTGSFIRGCAMCCALIGCIMCLWQRKD